ncbi:MAG: hypothetical protein JSW67_07160 [Candidatus Latescibacterota bacterium]|nr:MAG: hypothetical protein JSW67_07160 [Candidatus Latescibacterota bacterium]
MRRFLVGVLLAVASSAHAGAPWVELDARALAMGGIPSALAHSPGLLSEPGLALHSGQVELFDTSALRQQSLRARLVRSHWGMALALVSLRSPVHRENAWSLAAQLRASRWAAGASFGVREARFQGYATWSRASVICGVGFRPAAATRLAATFSPALLPHDRTRLSVALRLTLPATLLLAVESVREAALPGQLRAGVEWGASRLRLRGGYDAATRTLAVGIEAGPENLRLHASTSSHPELGWSSAWMLELRR